MSAAGRLARRLAAQREHDGQQQWTQGVVTAVPSSTTVSVDVGGSVLVVPRLRSYSAPAVGDVVWLGGPPGSWFCAGALA